MKNNFDKLSLDAKINLVSKMIDDFDFYQTSGHGIPKNQFFKIKIACEDLAVEQSARFAALKSFNNKIVKKAFDTRKVDQENERNPRPNLQYWHRSEPFIDEKDSEKIETFAQLAKTLNNIKKDLGTQPEWFESYARQLHDHVTRILRIKQGDLDIFKPQLSFLEQLIYARYRLTMDDIKESSEKELRKMILKKDEKLMKRGAFLEETGGYKTSHGPEIKQKTSNVEPSQQQIVIDGNRVSTQDSIVNAIFGQDLRTNGEKTVERTITITIKDSTPD